MRACNLLDYIMRCVLVISAIIYESAAAVGAESESERCAWSSSSSSSSRKCLKGRVMSTKPRAFNLGRARREATHNKHTISAVHFAIDLPASASVHPAAMRHFPSRRRHPLSPAPDAHSEHQEVQRENSSRSLYYMRFCWGDKIALAAAAAGTGTVLGSAL